MSYRIWYTKAMYKRILLKLSGEQLQGDFDGGFDTERAVWITNEIKQVVDAGTQVVVMVGGGNYVRGAQLANESIGRVTADNAGMMSTMINAIVLSDIFNHSGLAACALSSVEINQFLDQFTHRRAISHLEEHRVVLVAGGTGRPYLTTDTAAVNIALELDCDAIFKTTKVDGVYDRDPVRYPDATKLETISYQRAVEDGEIRVMDKAALGLAMEKKIPLVIFNLLAEGNIAKAARGEQVGTLVK
ncbi:uridylate kinase [candidate division TM7 genomosp. GTL1]|nr:uridylate kinase [candidate division TM7 genomosp. GTL1]